VAPRAREVPAVLNRFSVRVLIVCSFASTALLLWGASRLGVDPAWATRLCAAGAIGAVSFAAMLKLPSEWRVSASLAIISGSFGLTAVNLYFAFVPPDRSLNEKIDAARAASPGFDHRTVLEVVRDRNAATKPSVPALRPYYALLTETPPPLMPLSGISTATTVLCNESGAYAIYPSDELGFNNPRGLPAQVDIVIIGDSFAHGSCVPPGKDVASVLRNKGYSTLNLGMGGSGPIIELATLIEFGLPRKPKFVVWFFGGNDFSDLSLEMLDERLLRYLKEDGFSQNLAQRQSEVDAYWREYLASYTPPGASNEESLSRFTLREVLTFFPLRWRLGITRNQGRTDDRTLDRVIDRARRLTEASGGRFFFLALPYWELLHSRPDLERPFPELEQRLSEMQIETLDFLPVLKATEDPDLYFPLRLPGHYNEAGYQLLGDFIDEEISKRLAGR
jgi:hypothetical protein